MIGFLVSLPEHVDRFDPVARLLPGARFLVSTARWPSMHVDSRQLVLGALRRRGWNAQTAPDGAVTLLITGNHLAPERCAPWMHGAGRIILWRCEQGAGEALSESISGVREAELASHLIARDPIALVAAPGPRWLERLEAPRCCSPGDPRLDAMLEIGAAARGRAALGLRGSGRGRPVVLLRIDRPDGAVRTHASALSALRDEADIVLAPSSRCWLRGGRALPRPLHGPGLWFADPQLPLAELLALADLVLCEPGWSAAQSAAAGRKVAVLSDGPAHASSARGQALRPYSALLGLLPWIDEPERLHAVVPELLRAPQDDWLAARRNAERLSGTLDGGSAHRFAARIRELDSRSSAGSPQRISP